MQKILRIFKRKKRGIRLTPMRCVFVAVLAYWALALIPSTSPDISSVVSTIPNTLYNDTAITLPFTALSDGKHKMTLYKVVLNYKSGPSRWRIIGDDCIRKIFVNTQTIEFAGAGDPCNIYTGIAIDLSPYLAKGVNSVSVLVEDSGGSYAFNMKPASALPGLFDVVGMVPPMLLNMLAAAVFMYYACRFLVRQKIDGLSIGLFILTAIVSLNFLHISNNGTYTNDLGWHLGYINYVATHWFNPYGYTAWTITHPPLYYYVAAILVKLNLAVIALPEATILRFLSWVFFLVFHCYNLLTLRRAGFKGITYYACAALLLLWPGNMHLASKINSEAMYYAVSAISFYYIICWYQVGTRRDLMFAVIATSVAMTVRTNAVIIGLLLASLMIVAVLRGRLSVRDFADKAWRPVYAIVIVCALVCLGGLVLGSYVIDDNMVTALSPAHPSPFNLNHYLSLEHSFANPFNTWEGRQGFIEYLLKTSMFGEYGWTSPKIAIAMNCCVVFLFWYAALPWIIAKRAEWRDMLPHILYMVFSFLFVIYFSLCIRDWASQDARYIYPVLISFVVFFGRSHLYYRQREMMVLTWLGPLVALAFSVLSVYFFWNNPR